MTEFRTGLGWDSHRIKEGRPLLLGGIHVDCPFGLDGHSDADILLHALTDALLGAAAMGDIGMHFPDTDPQWKGAGSSQFLTHALRLVKAGGWKLQNADTTVILEKPKLKDYRSDIRENLARLLELPVDRVNVKFKTAEKVGPVGTGLSAEAQAIVLIAR